MKKKKVLRVDMPVTKIAEDVYLIDEFGGTNCYLIVGSERALLIDCGTGFCDIRFAVRNITSLPIVVAATHGHLDHVGGMGQFREIYVHKDDCIPMNRMTYNKICRGLFIRSSVFITGNGFKPWDVFDNEYKTKVIPFDDDKVFDLGNKKIRVFHTPGHSRGSVAFIDDADKIIFSGDNVCDALWLQVPGCTSVEEWLPSAKWLYEMSKDYRVFWAHRTPELTHEYIGTVISYGEQILKDFHENSKISKITQYPKKPDGIIFRTGNIFKKV